MRARYPTDMTDAEWEIVRGYVREAVWLPNLQGPKYSRRDIVDAIFYRERTGCQWRNLPHDFPPWKQVYEYYRLSSMIRLARAFDSPIGELLGMPEMSVDSIETARLLSVLPAEVREPIVNALRALPEVLRGRAPQRFASPSR